MLRPFPPLPTLFAIFVSISGISSALYLPSCEGSDLNQLKTLESKIQSVVEKTLESTVVVTDGFGSGSGVIVSKDGLVLTAGHVLMTRGKELELIMSDGTLVKAKKLGKCLDVDAGMAQIIEPGEWPAVDLGSSESVKRGDWVVAIGHPGGYLLGRTAPIRIGKVLSRAETLVVTDSALIGGDSGGPLFNLNGELVGIHSSIGESVALNRHVAIDAFRKGKNWERMLEGETWEKLGSLINPERRGALLGVSLDLNSSEAKIVKVHDGSAAEEAGIRVGDIIVEFDGQDVADSNDLQRKVGRLAPGEVVELKIIRNGTTKSLTATLGGEEG